MPEVGRNGRRERGGRCARCIVADEIALVLLRPEGGRRRRRAEAAVGGSVERVPAVAPQCMLVLLVLVMVLVLVLGEVVEVVELRLELVNLLRMLRMLV